jgi:hypothetical protein
MLLAGVSFIGRGQPLLRRLDGRDVLRLRREVGRLSVGRAAPPSRAGGDNSRRCAPFAGTGTTGISGPDTTDAAPANASRRSAAVQGQHGCIAVRAEHGDND